MGIKKLLSILLLRLATVLIRLKYGPDRSSDILKTHQPKGLKMDSIEGMSKVPAIHMKGISQMYRVKTKEGHELDAANEHILYKRGEYSGSGIPVPMDKLRKGDYLIAKDGFAEIAEISRIPEVFTFDVAIANQTNSYWTNGLMSHNSVTTAIFMVWYMLSNVDKTIVCLSQNEDKVKDLIEKIQTIIKNLPYHLKPGIVKWDVMGFQIDNGCKIKGQTTTPNSAAGITADVLYMDEFALVNKAFIKEFYRTAYPTISAMPHAKIIITSTPRGLNKFWELYDGALKGKNYYNPLRIDWWEVPGRDEEWKKKEIANIGSLEDFNQEYGNQFLAGNSMILEQAELKKIKHYEVEFVSHKFDILDEYMLEYEEILKWHPFFDTAQLSAKENYFVITIDLGAGDGGDFSVANIKQILPMIPDEMKRIEYFTDTKDFFKLVQVGLIRTNMMKVPKFADFCYKVLTSLIGLENFKIILEMNHAGSEFLGHFTQVFGPRNVIDEDSHFVKYKHRITDKAPRTGIKINEENKKSMCSKMKDKVKFNQAIICEKTTTQELMNFTKNENGTYSATSGYDDCIMTEVLTTSFYDTEDFYEFVEEMLPHCPEEFLAAMDEVMSKANPIHNKEDDEDDEYGDLF